MEPYTGNQLFLTCMNSVLCIPHAIAAAAAAPYPAAAYPDTKAAEAYPQQPYPQQPQGT